ncbi:MAG: hypothetical protein H0W94_06860, partial [Actinobacteria bacterium]|nr:hypothetical protein [Actinomycetota bacterium]
MVYVFVVLAALWVFLSFASGSPEARQLSLTRFEEIANDPAGGVRTATFLER